MSVPIRILGWLYAQSLNLYPKKFRTDFGDEMNMVFMQAIVDLETTGRIWRAFLREFCNLPYNLAREHWYARKKKVFPMLMIKKPEWAFYPTWVLLTTLSVPIAFFLDLIVLKVITRFIGDYIYVDGVRHITEDYLFGYTFVPILSFLTGILQFGLLQRYLSRMGWWVLSTIGGWFLGLLLILIPGRLNFWTPDFFTLDLVFVVLGLSIGLGQWLLLRRRLPRAGWWVGANLLGWVLLGLITPGNSLGQFGLLGLGFLPACTTAVMLALLINHAQPSEPHGA